MQCMERGFVCWLFWAHMLLWVELHAILSAPPPWPAPSDGISSKNLDLQFCHMCMNYFVSQWAIYDALEDILPSDKTSPSYQYRARLQCRRKVRVFFLVLPGVNLQKYSNILWLFILGKSLATQIIFFHASFLASYHPTPHPVEEAAAEVKALHPLCTLTTQNSCIQSPSRRRHRGAGKTAALPCALLLLANYEDFFSMANLRRKRRAQHSIWDPGSFVQSLSGSQALTLGMGTEFLKSFSEF